MFTYDVLIYREYMGWYDLRLLFLTNNFLQYLSNEYINQDNVGNKKVKAYKP